MSFCPPLPKRHPRVIKREVDTSEHDGIYTSTACWRGYQGTWEIREGRFYLADLAGGFELVGTDPLLAEWFSGVLRVPKGEIIAYVHMGFGSIFEEEIHIRVERGIVVGTSVVDNRGKVHDSRLIGWESLPGFENRFDGDGQPPGPGSLLGRLLLRIFG